MPELIYRGEGSRCEELEPGAKPWAESENSENGLWPSLLGANLAPKSAQKRRLKVLVTKSVIP